MEEKVNGIFQNKGQKTDGIEMIRKLEDHSTRFDTQLIKHSRKKKKTVVAASPR